MVTEQTLITAYSKVLFRVSWAGSQEMYRFTTSQMWDILCEPVHSGRVTRRELSKQIAEISTVSTVDTMAMPTTSNPGQAFKPVFNNMEFVKNGS